VPNSHSQIRLTSDRAHHVAPFGRALPDPELPAPSTVSSVPAPTGPSSFTAASRSSTSPGSRAARDS
jgi:hypothetical protein